MLLIDWKFMCIAEWKRWFKCSIFS